MAVGDRIELRGLRLAAIVGVLPHERTTAQPLELDLDVVADLAAAGQSDALEDTIDYGALCGVVEAVVTDLRPQLLEALAERVAGAVLDHDQRVAEVVVSVRKLRPPVAQHLDTSGVRVTRVRG